MGGASCRETAHRKWGEWESHRQIVFLPLYWERGMPIYFFLALDENETGS